MGAVRHVPVTGACGRAAAGDEATVPPLRWELQRHLMQQSLKSEAACLTECDSHGRSAVSISSFANGALGEQRRHDTDGIKLETAAPGCRSSVRRSSEPHWPHAGHE